MYRKWLKNSIEWLAEQEYKYLLCRTGRLDSEDLLFFELGERTHFIWIESVSDIGFWFGDVEYDGQDLSIGATQRVKFSDEALRRITEDQATNDLADFKNMGKIIHFGKRVTLEEIQQNWLLKNENIFSFRFYES